MRAVDADVVVRYLTADHPEQAARARDVFRAGQVFVSTTVLLESDWVLRSAYGVTAREVAAALRALAGLPGVIVEDPNLLREALDRTARGMNCADALHLGAAARCHSMLTFDRRFIRTADEAPISVREP